MQMFCQLSGLTLQPWIAKDQNFTFYLEQLKRSV